MLEIGGHHRVGGRADQDRRLERDRLAVGQAEPAQVDDGLADRDPEARRLGRRRRPDDPGEHARARDATGAGHLLGERHQPVGPAVGRRLGDEAAAARLAPDQPVLGEPLHRVAGGHPADPELLAQLGVGRQPLARSQRRDPFAERLLDLAVVRLVAGLDHRATSGRVRQRGPRRRRGGLGAVDRRADRAGPRPELGDDDLDLGRATSSGRGARSSARIGPSSRSRRGRDPAADHDPVRGDDRDHVGDPDPEIAADLGEPVERAPIAGAGARDRLLGRGRPARGGDLVGAGERLEAAAVAAAAPRPVRLDRLVAELAGGPVVPLDDVPVDRRSRRRRRSRA